MTVVGAGYSFLDEVWGEAPKPAGKKQRSRAKSVHCELAAQKPKISRPFASESIKGARGVETLHPDMKPQWEHNDRVYARVSASNPSPRDEDAFDDAYFDTALAAGADRDRDGLHDYQVSPPPAPREHETERIPQTAAACERSASEDHRRDAVLHDILRSAREAKEAAESAVAMIREHQREKSARSKNLDLVAYILGGVFTILVLEQVSHMSRD